MHIHYGVFLLGVSENFRDEYPQHGLVPCASVRAASHQLHHYKYTRYLKADVRDSTSNIDDSNERCGS